MMGWGLELVAVAVVFLFSAGAVIKRYRSGKPVDFIRSGTLMSPNQSWGPRPDAHILSQSSSEDNKGYE